MPTVMLDASVQVVAQVGHADDVSAVHEPVGCARYKIWRDVDALRQIVQTTEKSREVVMFEIERKRVPLLIAEFLDVAPVAGFVLESW